MSNLKKRRSFAVALILVLMLTLLAACGGPTNKTIPPPPGAREVTAEENALFQPTLDEARTMMGEKLTINELKPYFSTASLEDLKAFYVKTFTDNGWSKVKDSGDMGGVALVAAESGNDVVAVYIIGEPGQDNVVVALSGTGK